MLRRTDAWLCATEVIHVCKTYSSAVGFHQGVECGRIVREVGCASIAIVVGIPVVSRIVGIFVYLPSCGARHEGRYAKIPRSSTIGTASVSGDELRSGV